MDGIHVLYSAEFISFTSLSAFILDRLSRIFPFRISPLGRLTFKPSSGDTIKHKHQLTTPGVVLQDKICGGTPVRRMSLRSISANDIIITRVLIIQEALNASPPVKCCNSVSPVCLCFATCRPLSSNPSFRAWVAWDNRCQDCSLRICRIGS